MPAAVLEVVERCLRTSADERFRSAADIAFALGRADESAVPSAGSTWWRTHQLVIIGLYFAAASLGWQIKQWIEVPMTVSLFIALGVGAPLRR